MRIIKPQFLLLVAFMTMLSVGRCSRWKWLPKPRLPVSQATAEELADETNPVAIPVNPRTGKPHKGPVDWKQVTDFPIFTINPDDNDHGIGIFGKGGGCIMNAMAVINGLPKAIMESAYKKGVAQGGNAPGAQGSFRPGQIDGNLMEKPSADDGTGDQRKDWKSTSAEELTDVVLKAGMVGHAYGNPIQSGFGKSSACIETSILGQGAEHVSLWRASTRVPRTMAAMWHSEGCVGAPDKWVMMGLGEESVCSGDRGAWRSIRVWYGSERLKEDQWGEGTISLTEKLAEWKGGR